MATHSSVLNWRTLWTEESGGLPSTGLGRVGHDRATKTHAKRPQDISFYKSMGIYLLISGFIALYQDTKEI